MMDGILLINKEKGITSRDAVNEVSRALKTKKIGHTGTLDPNASGLLVLCVGKATKLVELLTNHDKEYIAEVTLGVKTDTIDPEGDILEEEDVYVDLEELKMVLNSFKGKYVQEVPIYSAIKINGKKLYEYARNKEEVELPKHEVEIKEIELMSNISNNGKKPVFTFRVVVSKGTYIRSLVRDIAVSLGTIGIMSNLVRTRIDNYKLIDAYTLEDIKKGNYEIKSIMHALRNYNHIVVSDELEFKISNGSIIDNVYNTDVVVFITKDSRLLGIYKKYDKDNTKLKPWKMF